MLNANFLYGCLCAEILEGDARHVSSSSVQLRHKPIQMKYLLYLMLHGQLIDCKPSVNLMWSAWANTSPTPFQAAANRQTTD